MSTLPNETTKKIRSLAKLQDAGFRKHLAAYIIEHALKTGYEIPALSNLVGVSRATIHNWINGAAVRKNNLLILVQSLDLAEVDFDIIYPNDETLDKRFDPESIARTFKRESLKKEYLELLAHVTKSKKEGSATNFFSSAFFKSHGKALIEASLNMPEGGRPNYAKTEFGTGLETVEEGYGDKLIILFSDSKGDWRYLPEPQLDAIRRLSICVHEAIGLEASSIFKLPQSPDELREMLASEKPPRLRIRDVYSIYDKIKKFASKNIPFSRIAMRHERSIGETYYPILDLWWETYRADRYFDEGEWLLTWLNDVDGRKIFALFKKRIKEAMTVGSRSLTIYLHQGRFIEEDDLFSDEDPDECEPTKKITYEEICLATAAGRNKHGLKNFQYGDEEELHRQEGLFGIYEYDDLDESAIIFLGYEFPHSFRTLEFIFQSLGYRAALIQDKPVKFIHEFTIGW